MTTRSQSSSKKSAGKNENGSSVLVEDEPTIIEVMNMLKIINNNIERIMSNQQVFETRFQSLEEKASLQHNAIKDLEKSVTFYVKEITDLQSDSKEMKNSLITIKEEIADYQTKIIRMQNEIDNYERYSRGFNLRFTCVPEEVNCVGERSVQENCIDKIEKLIFDQTGLKVDVENAHRVGRTGTGKPRHILVKFLRRPERFAVLKASSKLREIGINVNEDMTRKDFLKWISLQGVMKDAKGEGKRVSFNKGNLYIDGRPYST